MTTNKTVVWWLLQDAVTDFWHEDLLRPLVLLVAGMLLFNLPTLLYKIRLFGRSFLQNLASMFRRSPPPRPDPGAFFGPHLSHGLPVRRKTLYLIRYGSSTWSETFHRRGRSWLVFLFFFPTRLLKGLVIELYFLLSGKLDSWFFDPPQSQKGLQLAEQLAHFVQHDNNPHAAILRDPRSKVVCSNLRRATLLPLREHDLLHAALHDRPQDGLQQHHHHAVWHSTTARDTIAKHLEFCDFCFHDHNDDVCLIVGGHATWFLSFFRTLLPYSVQHVAKEQKLMGVVVLDLWQAETTGDGMQQQYYMIDPKSIQVVFGGFVAG